MAFPVALGADGGPPIAGVPGFGGYGAFGGTATPPGLPGSGFTAQNIGPHINDQDDNVINHPYGWSFENDMTRMKENTGKGQLLFIGDGYEMRRAIEYGDKRRAVAQVYPQFVPMSLSAMNYYLSTPAVRETLGEKKAISELMSKFRFIGVQVNSVPVDTIYNDISDWNSTITVGKRARMFDYWAVCNTAISPTRRELDRLYLLVVERKWVPPRPDGDLITSSGGGGGGGRKSITSSSYVSMDSPSPRELVSSDPLDTWLATLRSRAFRRHHHASPDVLSGADMIIRRADKAEKERKLVASEAVPPSYYKVIVPYVTRDGSAPPAGCYLACIYVGMVTGVFSNRCSPDENNRRARRVVFPTRRDTQSGGAWDFGELEVQIAVS